jgi:hypothetical protein
VDDFTLGEKRKYGIAGSFSSSQDESKSNRERAYPAEPRNYFEMVWVNSRGNKIKPVFFSFSSVTLVNATAAA